MPSPSSFATVVSFSWASSLDYLDSLDSGSEDYDVDPWLTICRGSNCPTLAEAIASLKEAISSHAKAIALVHPTE